MSCSVPYSHWLTTCGKRALEMWYSELRSAANVKHTPDFKGVVYRMKNSLIFYSNMLPFGI